MVQSDESTFSGKVVAKLNSELNKINFDAVHVNEVEVPKAVIEIKKNGTKTLVATVYLYDQRPPEVNFPKFIDNRTRSQIISIISKLPHS